MSLRRILSEYWFGLQAHLFPALEEAIGPLAERYQSFVAVLEFVRVERFLPHFIGLPGRPPEDRAALARACQGGVRHHHHPRPDRAACHRPAAASFVRLERGTGDPQRGDLLACLEARSQRVAEPPARGADRAGHRSSGRAPLARLDGDRGAEKPTPKPPQPAKPKRKRGRPRKGEQRPPKELRRLEPTGDDPAGDDRGSIVMSAPSATRRDIRSRGSATSSHRRG